MFRHTEFLKQFSLWCGPGWEGISSKRVRDVEDMENILYFSQKLHFIKKAKWYNIECKDATDISI